MIKSLIPLSWRIAARKAQSAVAQRLDPNHRASFVEDYVRVYARDEQHAGARIRDTSRDERNNYLNHQKFYFFANQFVAGKQALDAGCGSGYGCEMLAKAGATSVVGIDMSEHALGYAREHHAVPGVTFEQMSVTQLRMPSQSVDVIVCSEVLEHVLEFGTERKCVKEFARVLRPGGLAVLATPNAEMLPSHGYRFEQLWELVQSHFSEFVFFENAFRPFLADEQQRWEQRLAKKQTGVLIQQNIQVEETCPPAEYDLDNPEDLAALRLQVKSGSPPGNYPFGAQSIDTTLLHNTHSFLVVARK